MPITIGNRVTEKDIRDWLDAHGYNGHSAKINNLELHAIQRPGWIQVYRFTLRAKSLPKPEFDSSTGLVEDDKWTNRFGIVWDDERQLSLEHRTQIWILEDEEKQKLNLLSDGLLTCRRGQIGGLFWGIGILLVLLFIAGAFSSFLK